MALHTAAVEDRLMSKIGFSADELTANREGYMTEAQRERLRRKLIPYGSLVMGLSITVLLIVSYFGIQWLLGLSYLNDKGASLIILVIVGVIGIPLAMLESGIHQRRTRLDLHKGIVESACGLVHLEFGWRVMGIRIRTRNSHQLTIDGVRFAVSESVLLAFHDGTSYCVYYAPHRKIILSAEAVYAD